MIYSFKNKILILLLFSLLSIITNCNYSEKENAPLYTVELVSTDSILTVNYDSLSAPLSSQVQVFEGMHHDRMLYSLNLLKNCVEYYNWTSGKLLKRLPLDIEGPNGVGIVTAMYVKSPDSLYLLATYTYTLSLVDSTGKLLKKYSLLPNRAAKAVLGQGVICYGGSKNKMIQQDGYLYIPASPYDDFTNESFYSDGYYGLKLDLLTGKISTLMQVPSDWKNNFNESYILPSQRIISYQTYDLKKSNVTINYPSEKYLYQINLESGNVVKHLANSKYFGDISWFPKKEYSIEKEFLFHTKTPYYESIYYDPYQCIYLRFVAHPNAKKENKFDGKAWYSYSVIVLDENYKIIGETMLSNEVRSPHLLITEVGLFVEKYIESEDQSIFKLYQVKKINS